MSERKLKHAVLAAVVLCAILSISLVYALFEINNLNDIVNLRKSETWIDTTIIIQPNQTTHYSFNASYHGYLDVEFASNYENVSAYVNYAAYGRGEEYRIWGYDHVPIAPSTVNIVLRSTDLPENAAVKLLVKYFY